MRFSRCNRADALVVGMAVLAVFTQATSAAPHPFDKAAALTSSNGDIRPTSLPAIPIRREGAVVSTTNDEKKEIPTLAELPPSPTLNMAVHKKQAEKENNNRNKAIVGGVVGGLIFLICWAAAGYLYLFFRKHKKIEAERKEQERQAAKLEEGVMDAKSFMTSTTITSITSVEAGPKDKPLPNQPRPAPPQLRLDTSFVNKPRRLA